MKNYVFNSNEYSTINESISSNAGLVEAFLKVGPIRMKDGSIHQPSEFVNIVNAALMMFHKKHPWEYKFIQYARILYLLDGKITGTMCVDDRGDLYINVEFLYSFLKMNPKYIMIILYHEAMHNILNHVQRSVAYNKKNPKNRLTWTEMNVCTDLEVNNQMVSDHICTASDWYTLHGCFDPVYKGLTFELIANKKNQIKNVETSTNWDPSKGGPKPPKKDEQSADYKEGMAEMKEAIDALLKANGGDKQKTVEDLQDIYVKTTKPDKILNEIKHIMKKLSHFIIMNSALFEAATEEEDSDADWLAGLQAGFDEALKKLQQSEEGEGGEGGGGGDSIDGVPISGGNGGSGEGPDGDGPGGNGKGGESGEGEGTDGTGNGPGGDDNGDSITDPGGEPGEGPDGPGGDDDPITEPGGGSDGPGGNDDPITEPGGGTDDGGTDGGGTDDGGTNEGGTDGGGTDGEGFGGMPIGPKQGHQGPDGGPRIKPPHVETSGLEDANTLVGRIVKHSEIEANLQDSLKASGYDPEEIISIYDEIASRPAPTKIEMNSLRDEIIKNKKNSVLSELCNDVNVDETVVDAVWDELVKKFLQKSTTRRGSDNTMEDEKSIKWGNKRYLSMDDIVMPYHGKTSAAPQYINIFVDCSGSIDAEICKYFLSVIEGLCTKLEFSGIRLIPFSDEVEETKIAGCTGDELQDKRTKENLRLIIDDYAANYYGGGGNDTSFLCMANFIKKCDSAEPESVYLVMTDGGLFDINNIIKLRYFSERMLFCICDRGIEDTLKSLYGYLRWCVDPKYNYLNKVYIDLDKVDMQ